MLLTLLYYTTLIVLVLISVSFYTLYERKVLSAGVADYLSMRTIKQNPITSALWSDLITLPTPSAITSNWAYGSTLGVCMVVQILTGLFLAMHYSADVSTAFEAATHIWNDVNFGWWARSIHANGASLVFTMAYCHIGRGLYYGSYQHFGVWMSGVTILFLLMAAAFLGYVLPWGQMSFWGATVITNLISAVPYFGESIVYWVWGGFAVGGGTLTRFFAVHFLVPFVVLALVGAHLLALHEKGSSNPLGLMFSLDKIPFHPYFSVKDLGGWLVFFGLLLILSLVSPWWLGDSENFIPANSLVTPVHIKPEWYFLFAYAILRSIPNKLGGVVSLVLAIAVLYVLPLSKLKALATPANPLRKALFWWFVACFIILTWIGGMPVESPYVEVGQTASVLYFSYFLALMLLFWSNSSLSVALKSLSLSGHTQGHQVGPSNLGAILGIKCCNFMKM